MNGFEQYVLFQLLRDIKMCQIAKATPGFQTVPFQVASVRAVPVRLTLEVSVEQRQPVD